MICAYEIVWWDLIIVKCTRIYGYCLQLVDTFRDLGPFYSSNKT